ncbi:hypothetical protein [Gemmatimonas sp.]
MSSTHGRDAGAGFFVGFLRALSALAESATAILASESAVRWAAALSVTGAFASTLSDRAGALAESAAPDGATGAAGVARRAPRQPATKVTSATASTTSARDVPARPVNERTFMLNG